MGALKSSATVSDDITELATKSTAGSAEGA